MLPAPCITSSDYYHVMNRGNNRQDIFLSEKDRKVFLEALADSCANYQVHLMAYVLMTNHFLFKSHFVYPAGKPMAPHLLRCQGFAVGNYSFALGRREAGVPSAFAQLGPKSLLVEADEYLLPLSRYIHINPVRTRQFKNSDFRAKAGYLKKYAWPKACGKWPWNCATDTAASVKNRSVKYSEWITVRSVSTALG
jgi:REP-associated tyrosine transposase